MLSQRDRQTYDACKWANRIKHEWMNGRCFCWALGNERQREHTIRKHNHEVCGVVWVRWFKWIIFLECNCWPTDEGVCVWVREQLLGSAGVMLWCLKRCLLFWLVCLLVVVVYRFYALFSSHFSHCVSKSGPKSMENQPTNPSSVWLFVRCAVNCKCFK